MNTETIGERLRRYRRAANKTLQTLAAEAGVTAGFLSQAERNLTGLSLSSLANLAKALDIPLRALVDAPAQNQPDSHQGQRQTYSVGAQTQRYERLSTSFPGSVINAVKMVLPPGYRSEIVSHDGDEFVYVLTGRVVYRIADQDFPLAAGDSLHFDAHRPHQLRNVDTDNAEVISVGTLAIFDDGEKA